MAQTIQTVAVPSRCLGRDQPVSLLAPSTFDAEGRCRTLYLLHGMGGDHLSAESNSKIADLVADQPIAVVMPSAQNSFYLDSNIALMETFLCDELIGFVDGAFPTIPSARYRWLSGYSMGGYGALLLALRRPDLFGSAASHSGAVLTARATTEVGVKWELADTLYGTGPEGEAKRREHDILTLAQRFLGIDPVTGAVNYSGPALYLDCGESDFLFYASRALTQAMRMLRIPYEYRETPGDHNWEYWRVHLADGLNFHIRSSS